MSPLKLISLHELFQLRPEGEASSSGPFSEVWCMKKSGTAVDRRSIVLSDHSLYTRPTHCQIPSWGWESQLQGGSCRASRPWAQCFDRIVAHSDGVARDGATGHNGVPRSQRGPKHLLINGDSAGQRKYFADGHGVVCGCKQRERNAGDGGVDE